MRGLDSWIYGDPDAGLIEDEREAALNAPTIEDLIGEYEDWLQQNDLHLGSADEHLFDEDLTLAQREWLKDFCVRWEEAEDRERGDRRGSYV